MTGFGIIASSFVGALVGSAITAVITPVLINSALDRFVKQFTAKGPKQNTFLDTIYQMKSTDPMMLSEISLRAETGEALIKPADINARLSHLDKLLLNASPILTPPQPSDDINTRVIIGAGARRPFTLKTPVLLPHIPGVDITHEATATLIKAGDKIGIGAGIGGEWAKLGDKLGLIGRCLVVSRSCNDVVLPDNLKMVVGLVEFNLGRGSDFGVPFTRTLHEEEEDRAEPSKQELITTDFYRVRDIKSLKRDIDRYRDEYEGVPIGIKLPGSSKIEDDVDILLKCGVDFITIEGAEGGAALAPAITSDGFGLPLVYALTRARARLQKENALERVALLASGGLRQPADILKMLALGASACYLGTACLIAMLQSQSTKALPFLPMSSLISPGYKSSDKFDPIKGQSDLEKYLSSCDRELKIGLQALRKTDITQLRPTDLVALAYNLAKTLGLEYAGGPGVQEPIRS